MVADASGNCGAVITCPFHGWSYGLDGGLRGVPFPKAFGQLDRASLGLKPLGQEIWHGMVFVRFKGEGPSIAETLAPIEAAVAPYRLEEMRPLGDRWREEFEANWKATVDVDNEGYHVPNAHPALNDLYGHSYVDEMLENRISKRRAASATGATSCGACATTPSCCPRRPICPIASARPGSTTACFRARC